MREEHKNSMYNDLNESKVNEMNDIITNIGDNIDNMDKAMLNISEIMYNSTFDIFGKSYSMNPNKNSLPKSDWFDDSCRSAKLEYTQATRHREKTESDESRRMLIKKRKLYNVCIRKPKQRFNCIQKDEMLNAATHDPQYLWKRVKKRATRGPS